MVFKVGVPYYKEEDYVAIKAMSSDGDRLEVDWSTWKKAAEKRISQLDSMGVDVARVIIIPSELEKYCATEKLEINGKARAALADKLKKKS